MVGKTEIGRERRRRKRIDRVKNPVFTPLTPQFILGLRQQTHGRHRVRHFKQKLADFLLSQLLDRSPEFTVEEQEICLICNFHQFWSHFWEYRYEGKRKEDKIMSNKRHHFYNKYRRKMSWLKSAWTFNEPQGFVLGFKSRKNDAGGFRFPLSNVSTKTGTRRAAARNILESILFEIFPFVSLIHQYILLKLFYKYWSIYFPNAIQLNRDIDYDMYTNVQNIE